MRATLAAPALLLAALALAPAPAGARPAASPAWSGPYSVELTDERGRVLPTFTHEGRTYVLGRRGDRYLVRVRNGSPRRAEVVVSVDGRDVLDGEPSAMAKRGYLVDAWSEVTIDGFRLSHAAVAAFRFSSVSRSYAARMGDARDVGVVGVAVFPERLPPPADEAAAAGAARDGHSPQAGLRAERKAERRPGLGTEFGEQHDSRVTTVPFERASSRPAAVLSLRYDDRRGLLALGIDLDGRHASEDAWLREHADPFRRDPGYARPPPGWRP
jgi:hypothetical protein